MTSSGFFAWRWRGPTMPKGIGCFAASLVCGAACAAEIKTAPSQVFTLNPAYSQRGHDVLVHSAVIRTGPGEHLTVNNFQFDLMAGETVIASRIIAGDDAVITTRELLNQPIEGLRNAQLLDPKGLAGWFGPDVRWAQRSALAPNEALAVTGVYFAINATPDRLRIRVSGLGEGGRQTITKFVSVRIYNSPINYRFPLKGAWLEASLPILQSHHRFIPSNEFAADFFKVDAAGETLHDGTADVDHWYAYGQPVLAAADGDVVRSVGDRVQDRDFLVTRPGETSEQRSQRINQTLEERAGSNFPDSILGNVVIIRHQIGHIVEYSSYDHLRTGSVRVKVGDHVKAGDFIAEVGDTGDTTIVHLHFQVNAGPDPFFSPSLPFHLSGMDRNGSTQDPGWFVQSQ